MIVDSINLKETHDDSKEWGRGPGQDKRGEPQSMDVDVNCPGA